MQQRYTSVALAVLLLLAGCSGFLAGSSSEASGARYGVAVQNGYDSPQTFGVRVTEPMTDYGSPAFNRSRTLDAGERWHVANLSAAEYAGEGYALQFLVNGEVAESVGLQYEDPRPDRSGNVTWATLFVAGESSTGTSTCVGQGVTCYEDDTGS